MKRRWINLNKLDRATYRATFAFLDGRLEERATVDWALGLKPKDWISRMVLLDLIDQRKMSEPWQSAWRLIEESWNNPVEEDTASSEAYNAQDRIRAGDRSGSLVAAIVELVVPKLKVEPISNWYLHTGKIPRRPKKIEDLFVTRLTSGEIVDPGLLELEGLTECSFLLPLAHALDATVIKGLDIARQIGWDGERAIWRLGGLHRVYYVQVNERGEENDEPDEFHPGIAPSVKLLHATVSRLVDIEISKAVEFVQRWKILNSPVHLRLWAALSRNPRVTPVNEVGDLLLTLDDQRFWDLNDFPEICELRARRFSELAPHKQAALIARIRKCPPRNQWPQKAEANKVKNARVYRSILELRRIEIGGTSLPPRDKVWLDAKIHDFPSLVGMSQIDEGFLDSPKAQYIPPSPDNRYDLLSGENRLKALETSLSSPQGGRGWDDSPAADWVRQQETPVKLLVDFKSIPDGGAVFTRVWEQFGWVHMPVIGQTEDAAQRDLPSECAHVLSLLDKLPEGTICQAINGISSWLSNWKIQVVVLPEGFTVWLKLWPIAVETTNAKEPGSEHFDLNTVEYSTADQKPKDLDTLSTPAGKLVGVFLAACPTLQENVNPFDRDEVLRKIRDAVITATGRSGLIARHRMIEALPYFLNTDPNWTQLHLITPLSADNTEAIALWRAIGRRTHFSNVLKIIGDQIAKRATDQRLDRDTRRSLVFSLILECLHAFREKREPTVQFSQVQQVIRSVEDEVRAHGAGVIKRFIRDLSKPREGTPNPPSSSALFRSVAAPFLQEVWPQERSLATPGISRALADLPATAKGAFAEAVDAIERFLVPFECWSMLEYGLYGEDDDKPKLSMIDNHKKADALLRLLDLTVGTADRSVVPHNLGDALDQIHAVAPKLENEQAFRRLRTAARR